MIQRIRDWVGGLAAKSAASVLKALAPGLIANLLSKINPEEIAFVLRPHVFKVMAALPPEWRQAYAKSLKTLADIVQAAVRDLKEAE